MLLNSQPVIVKVGGFGWKLGGASKIASRLNIASKEVDELGRDGRGLLRHCSWSEAELALDDESSEHRGKPSKVMF